MKKTTSANYRQRLTVVIDYIHDNINGALDVNTLADVAFMSPYHFHRIYRELMQETVNATVRRLRLQKAAIDLIRTDQSIQTIAQGISYGSVEAFTRAFSKQFCVSPS
jgi:AraC family transcriptional regulator